MGYELDDLIGDDLHWSEDYADDAWWAAEEEAHNERIENEWRDLYIDYLADCREDGTEPLDFDEWQGEETDRQIAAYEARYDL